MTASTSGQVLFPDISEYQPAADLAGIKRQNGGAIIIRQHNGKRPDYYGPGYRAVARKLKFPVVGLYQYVVADRHVLDQAAEFCALVGRLQPGEFPMMDLEEGTGDQLARAEAWLGYVEDHLGDPVLYSYVDFVLEHGLLPVYAGNTYATNIAAWGIEPANIPHDMWQCTNGVVGVNQVNWAGCGYCDTNLFHGTLNDLVKLANGDRQPVTHPHRKDIFDMSRFVFLSRTAGAPAIALKAGQWLPLRFDETDGTKRGDWEIIAGDPHLSSSVMGTVTVHYDAAQGDAGPIDYRVVGVHTDTRQVRELGPTVQAPGLGNITDQIAVNAYVPAGWRVWLIVRPEHDATIASCSFTGFVENA